MYPSLEDIYCKYGNNDCFANKDGFCEILNEMPEKWECPFYKPRYLDKNKEEGD